MKYLVKHEELELGTFNPDDRVTRVFHGEDHGVSTVSCILSETPPGFGAPEHTHSYDEVFVIHEGCGRFTVEGIVVEAKAGDVVIVPAGSRHEFVNNTDEVMRHTAFHASERVNVQRVG